MTITYCLPCIWWIKIINNNNRALARTGLMNAMKYLERTRSWLPDRSWVPWDMAACFRTRRPELGSRRRACRSIVGRRPAGRQWNSRGGPGRSRHIGRASVVRTAPSSWWSPRLRSIRRETPPCRSSRRPVRLRRHTHVYAYSALRYAGISTIFMWGKAG